MDDTDILRIAEEPEVPYPNPIMDHRFVVWTSTSTLSDLDTVLDHVVTLKPVFSLPLGLSKLLHFRTLLELRRGASDQDPETFVTDDLASRNGKGSRDLLLGVPVDTRSNPVHRHAVQYISDFGLIPSVSQSKGLPEIVTSVSYGCAEQDKLSNSMFWFSDCKRLIVIALEEGTAFNEQYPMSVGDISIVSVDKMRTQFRLFFGSAIYIVMGYPTTYSRGIGRSVTGAKYMTSAMTLSSIAYPGINTVNRKSDGKSLTHVSCPDCRRPLEVVKAVPRPESPKLTPQVLVTVVCDEEDCLSAIKTGRAHEGEFDKRIVLATDPALLRAELLEVWDEYILVPVVMKHSQKRGLADYSVPEGFVSPVLFPNSIESTSKPTMYTILQALQCKELLDTPVLLVDPNGNSSVCIKPDKKTYELMMQELRDWNHPCHKARGSALAFVKEWIEIYC